MLRLFAACTVIIGMMTSVYADEVSVQKAKAKARAIAAISIESECAKSVTTTPIKMTLEKAKHESEKTGKPIVMWVHDDPSQDLKDSVKAVHVTVTEYLELKDAKCIIFTCANGVCTRRSSTNTTPSVSLLKTMVHDVVSETAKPEDKEKKPVETGNISTKEFFISTDMEEAIGEDVPLTTKPKAAEVVKKEVPKKTMMIKVTTPQCTVNPRTGLKTCSGFTTTWKEVPVNDDGVPDNTDVINDGGGCNCPGCSGSSNRVMLFPRLQAFSERERFFGRGRFLSRLGAFLGR